MLVFWLHLTVWSCLQLAQTCISRELAIFVPTLMMTTDVIVTKIARSQVLRICACYKHNESVDIGEKTVFCALQIAKHGS